MKTFDLICQPQFYIYYSPSLRVAFPSYRLLSKMGLQPHHVLYLEHTHHVNLTILWPGDVSLGREILSHITVPITLVLDAHKWSKSKEHENHLSIYTT